MLTRLYVDNFRSLVNFELKFDRLNVLMGANGSGKSTVFEVLRRLQGFICDDRKARATFVRRDLTRWDSRLEQRFELDISLGEVAWEYVLVIKHNDSGEESEVKEELLKRAGDRLTHFNQKKLEASDEEGDLVEFVFKSPSKQSSHLRFARDFADNSKIGEFSAIVSKFVIASISPREMESFSREESSALLPQMENFISWYRRISHQNMGAMVDLFAELKKILPGFSSFSLRDSGEDTKSLKVLFDAANKKGSLTFDFSELSDGQRALIALYALIYGMKGEGLTLFLDEPDNFVALREIQPWLATLQEEAGESFEQAVLISHHPEVIDYLGSSGGRWFSRDGAGPTRTSNEAPQIIDGLSLSETIARGWEE